MSFLLSTDIDKSYCGYFGTIENQYYSWVTLELLNPRMGLLNLVESAISRAFYIGNFTNLNLSQNMSSWISFIFGSSGH